MDIGVVLPGIPQASSVLGSSSESDKVSTEITVLNGADRSGSVGTVRVRSGRLNRRTDIQVTIHESRTRNRRRRKERRGNRWTHGKIDLRFGTLEVARERQLRSGAISLSGQASLSGTSQQRERLRGRLMSEKQQRIQKTVKGVPFNYFHTVNKIFSRLSVPNQRPHTDYTITALAIADNGNRIPLSVMGISTSLIDLGYSQKDFLVGAKAVFIGEEIIVEPSRSDEQRVNLESLEPGQGILMLEYFALSNRVAHVFTKGQISAENHRKGLAMCVSVCKDLANSAVELLRKKYENSSSGSLPSQKTALKRSPILPVATPQTAALKTSFSEMLSTTGTGVAHLESFVKKKAAESAPTKVLNQPTPGKLLVAGKKLSLADLAKGKK